MKTLIALLSAGSLAFLFGSCERHSWEGSTKKLFDEQHGEGSGHNKHEGEGKVHHEGEKVEEGH